MVFESAKINGQVTIPALVTSNAEIQPASDPSVSQNVQYWKDGVQKNANNQVLWSKIMSDGQNKSWYKHVEVLLLSWHPACDDLNVEKEVKDLGAVFKDTYNYGVTYFQLDARERLHPQAQANKAVSDFVCQHDVKEDSLFIIYYAGHGRPGDKPGDLKLSGHKGTNKSLASRDFKHLTWNEVESNLKPAKAHIFMIFDCCHSSDLGRDSSFTSRSWDYLAASTQPKTRAPGQNSFTTALIWALKELARDKNPMFPTTILANKVSECPDFPIEQRPELTTRNESYEHVFLNPLTRAGEVIAAQVPNRDHGKLEEDDDDDENPEEFFLNLIFHFKHDEDEEELQKSLGRHLKKFKLSNPSLFEIKFGGTWNTTARERWHRALNKINLMPRGYSPISSQQDSNSALVSAQQDRLSPGTARHSPFSTTEQTPLLSETSSVTVNDEGEVEDRTLGFWTRVCTVAQKPVASFNKWLEGFRTGWRRFVARFSGIRRILR